MTITKKQKNKKNKKITISFDEDFSSNQEVQKIIDSCQNTQPKKQKEPELNHPSHDNDSTPINNEDQSSTVNTETPPNKKKRKRNKKNEVSNDAVKETSATTETAENESQFELNPVKPQIEGEESIRQKKRKRYLQLLEDKKLKSELKLQQSCLNYISQWKHSKATWKFEKLKQIWIQQHMFDETRIPDDVWMTVVEYFSKAVGKIKSTIMKEALKIVEAGSNPKGDEDTEVDVKYERARYVIQNLQE